MSSWRLFSYLTPFGTAYLYPALRQRARRRSSSAYPMRAVGFPVRDLGSVVFVVCAVIFALFWCVAPSLWNQQMALFSPAFLLILAALTLLPSLVLWIVPLGVALGPVIARERSNHTWDVLRLIPADLDLLVLTQAHTAIMPLYPALQLARVSWLLASLATATLSLNLLDSLTLTYTSTYGSICGAGIAFLLAGAIIFVLDRMQQYTLMGVAALAASASAASAQRATVWATLAAGMAWLVDTGVAVVVLVTLSRWVTLTVVTRSALLVMLGPVGGYLAELHIHDAAACITVTFLARELAIRALWRWTLRAAQS